LPASSSVTSLRPPGSSIGSSNGRFQPMGFLPQIVLTLDLTCLIPAGLVRAARRVSSGNRCTSGRFNWRFKFLELDDDGCLASIAKEKFGFAVGPSGSDPASVAELKCFPQIMSRQIGDHPSAAFDRGQRVFRHQHDCGDRIASAISGSSRCKIAPRHTSTTSNLRKFAGQRSLANLSKARTDCSDDRNNEHTDQN
jgi:hypothetical protein